MPDTFGKRLREFRQEKGITLLDLAEKAGVNLNTISRWERDESEPFFHMLVYVADVLGVSLDYLAGRSERW